MRALAPLRSFSHGGGHAGGGLGVDFNGRLSSALFPLVSRRRERALIPIRCAFTLLLKRVYTAGCVDAAAAAVEF